MVYTGKPSRGCQNCKTRRIKCDEVRPACTQCTKSGRICPGYKDEFDLIFRDENAAVARRTQRVPGSKSGSQSSSSRLSPFAISDDDSSLVAFSETPSPQESTASSTFVLPSDSSLLQAYSWWLENELPASLTPSTEAQATAFFFRNFVLLPQQPESQRGFLELLLPLYNKTSASSPLHLATTAVALSALGNYPGRQQLLREAATHYGQALQHVGRALQDPVEARSDETLLAILLFSLYEAIVSSDDSASAWAHHVDGAVTITKLRGMEQFRNEQSFQIFRAVRTMMLNSCVQRSMPVEDFPGPHGWMGEEDVHENAANRLTVISMDLPAIRARTRTLLSAQKSLSMEVEAFALIEAAQMVDTNLEQWALTLPSNWSWRTVSIVQQSPEDLSSAEAWPGPQHAYEDVFIANIINDYRVSRIFCQGVILRCAAWIESELNNPRTAETCIRARFILQQMVDDISSSIPFHMSYEMQSKAQMLGQDVSAAEALGGYFLVWPLFVAANTEYISSRQRAWLHGRLFHIGREFGLNQAQILGLARKHILTCGPAFP